MNFFKSSLSNNYRQYNQLTNVTNTLIYFCQNKNNNSIHDINAVTLYYL